MAEIIEKKNRNGSVERRAYRNAKYRCQNSDHVSYSRYGGKGIEFRFASFEDFIAAVGKHPGTGYSLDRFPDNQGHYEEGNVRWATLEEQVANKGYNRNITHDGETLTAAEWSRRLGGKRNLVLNRLDKGWCEQCAVTIDLSRKYHTVGCPHRENV